MKDHLTKKHSTRYSSLLFLLFVFIAYPFSAHADADNNIQTIELTLGDTVFNPGNGIKLKALALKTKPEVDINKARLLAVEVLAKSRQGKGMIRLRVGNSLSKWAPVGGSEKIYENKSAESFSTIKLRSPADGREKVWQLIVNGYIKVRKIVLYITEVQGAADGSV